VTSLLLLACTARAPSEEPAEHLLAGSVTLSIDVTASRARLQVTTIEPARGVLPADRHGIPLGRCAVLEPVTPLAGHALRGSTVEAWCDEVALSLTSPAPGVTDHLFAGPPDPGTACEVEIDGSRITLPAVPEAPLVEVSAGRLRWQAGGGDELRYVIPRSDGLSTICRLEDDGDAEAPPGAGSRLSFSSRVRLALPELEGRGRLPVAVIVGSWSAPAE